MMSTEQKERTHFLRLNSEGKWLGFSRSGLELRDDGSLSLIRLPALEGDLPPALEGLDAPDGPAGLVVASDGTVYYTDPAAHILYKIEPCPVVQKEPLPGNEPQDSPCPGDRPMSRTILLVEEQHPGWPVACLGGQGGQGTQFNGPRGLLFHPIRNLLMVADSGNHRIQFFDPASYQLMDSWGQEGREPGEFHQPWSLAADTLGNVYVVDRGNRRVQKFDRWGNVVADFWRQMVQTLQAEGYRLHQPAEVAVAQAAGEVNLYVLDSSGRQIFTFDAKGHVLHPPFGREHLQAPMGLVAGERTIYVGDNHRRRILQFDQQGAFIGEALRYEGPVAALALDGRGGLLVLAHPAMLPLRLAATGGYTRNGHLWGGPFNNPGPIPQEWHRLKASLDPLPAGSHFQLFVYYASSTKTDPIGPPGSQAPWIGSNIVDFSDCLVSREDAPVCEDQWVRMPLDAFEAMIPALQTKGQAVGTWKYLNYVWIGAELSGDGLSSPHLSQMVLDFDHETYLRYLPPIYRENDRSRRYLGRFLSLFESLYDDVEDSIRDIPELFDPQAAREEFLPWLSGWMGFELEDRWSAEKKRRAAAQAFQLHGQRGTAAGLQAMVRFLTGVEILIEEPLQYAGWWSLASGDHTAMDAGTSVLGVSTYLVAAEAQGAVMGTTAVLDGSHLITQEELGAPLFSDTAHRFIAYLYRGAKYSEQAVAEVSTVLDREKPAHTHYHLCTIEPRFRVGFQARIGVDTIVAGAQRPSALDQWSGGQEGWQLGGEPPGRIGESSQLGKTARLAG